MDAHLFVADFETAVQRWGAWVAVNCQAEGSFVTEQCAKMCMAPSFASAMLKHRIVVASKLQRQRVFIFVFSPSPVR